MLVRIFETPVLDVLLIVLAIRFIWPSLFGIRKKKTAAGSGEQSNYVKQPPAANPPKSTDRRGEYIDYEEIK
ncbi:MAG: DUF4834 family protein [Chitinophagales bacterium]|nr:DUF4834 family protein [Chitinophagales bacterium]